MQSIPAGISQLNCGLETVVNNQQPVIFRQFYPQFYPLLENVKSVLFLLKQCPFHFSNIPGEVSLSKALNSMSQLSTLASAVFDMLYF